MGGLGAAAAAGKILALDQERLMRAMGLAATMAGGLRENFGTMTKAFHSGRAAESGVVATALAQSGFTSAPHILEARRGFFLAMGGHHDAARISGKLGNPFFIMDPGIHIKRYPCAILVHPAIRAVAELARSHSLTAEKVTRIDLGVNDVVTSTLNHPDPKTGLEGKFSVVFPIAVALVQGTVGLDDFTDEKVTDSRVAAVMKKITVHTDPTLQESGGNEVTAKLSIYFQDGGRLDHLATLAKGTHDWISETELREKFRACAARVLPLDRVNKALDLLLRIEVVEHIDSLMELLRTKA
jgi:2-methylcitrate dehydratase PrpD